MSNNGKQDENNEKGKYCPFLKETCLEDKCALYNEMSNNVVGLKHKFGMCSFSATVLILSQINMRDENRQQQPFQLPNILGRG